MTRYSRLGARLCACYGLALALGLTSLSCGDPSGNLSDAATPADDAQGDDGAAPDAHPAPSVTILEPSDGDTVENPVTFRVAATGVSTVELLADDWPLGDPWDPTVTDTLTYSFTELGSARTIVLRGYDGPAIPGTEVATDTITITAVSGDIGTYLMSMWNTYYYLANEADHSGPDDTTLYDASCNPIAQVPASFSDSVCIEGSGILNDSTVINYASTCNCGRPCPYGSNPIICYVVLDPVQYPWGMGSASNPLEPLISWAVDNSVIAHGTLIYAEQWDGVTIPSIDGLGGFVHDGCFRADDIGGGIQGDHFDFYAGTHGMYLALEALFPTYSDFDIYVDPGKCAYLQ